MKVVQWITFLMSAVFIFGETARRGFGYFQINATTMVEDYICGLLLLAAAYSWTKKLRFAPTMMVAAWGYATGGMFVPFFAHLEAYLRGATIRPDHPYDDFNSVVLKGTIWAICSICFIVSLYANKQKN